MRPLASYHSSSRNGYFSRKLVRGNHIQLSYADLYPVIALLFGVIFSPHALGWIQPLSYTKGSEVDVEYITLYFSRLVLGVQLVLAGVQLPSQYFRTEWKSLALLLGPGMIIMWIVSSLLVWAMVPNLPIVFALAIGACITPTDPILSNTIVKGRFADANVPEDLQNIIIAESGTNDGLGYPFLFLPLYIIRYINYGGGQPYGTQTAVGLWFGETLGYEILLSIAYGTVVGWLAKELLRYAERHNLVDRESFLVFSISIALFIIGTCGLIGSDDVLACFIAGNVFTWDDWFRKKTQDDSLQPTIELLLNVALFFWLGVTCPWHSFVANDVIPIYRLIGLALLILLLRRLPMVLGLHFFIHQIKNLRFAFFVGFFGPIGISAIFYLYVSLEFLQEIADYVPDNEEVIRMMSAFRIVIWFMVVCSIVVHGLSIPLGKLGYKLPQAVTTD